MTAAAALARALAAPARVRGGFVLAQGPSHACSAPTAMLRRHPGAVIAVTEGFLATPTPAVLARLATALRQEVGRDLRGARGLAPAGLAEADGQGVRLTALAAVLDGVAAPGTLDALARIFHDNATARWAAWGLRAAEGRGRCSRRS